MPGIIVTKLNKAERHAKNVREGKSPSGHPLGLEQEWNWLFGSIFSAKYRAEVLVNTLQCLNEIKNCIEKGGEPVFTIKQIKHIFDSLYK